MPIDVDAVRADTPGCEVVAHFNSAGSSLPPVCVVDSVVEYLRREALIGGYEIADERHEDLSAVYTAACSLFGGRPDNWAFVESATRAWNAAFSALRFEVGDRVLTTRAEYPSNMGGLLRAGELQGVEIVVVPDDEHGQVDVSALESLLDERTRLVSLMHVPTQGGLVNPVIEVGRLLRDTPILYQVDACQSVGQLPVDVDTIGCDILSFTGRKFLRGPRGTGMVWAGDAALERMANPAGVDGWGSSWDEPMTITPAATARRFEPYEVFFAGKVGLATAMRYAADIGVAEIAARNELLAGRLREALTAIDAVTVRDQGTERCAIVTFTVAGHAPRDIQTLLRGQRINVSIASQMSARLDFPDRGLDEVVRASVHYFNTIDEVDALVAAIERLELP
ncbi:aminotransferase class V-fold PLP-dependent enzyme [Ilumatobacter sp.]|uniref:aminotransferase class V-fold PLP-dependent enzyme n=1 Tax=Ilumatobacter sp. TaxID=1967498 RepID=UPI003AF598E0